MLVTFSQGPGVLGVQAGRNASGEGGLTELKHPQICVSLLTLF